MKKKLEFIKDGRKKGEKLITVNGTLTFIGFCTTPKDKNKRYRISLTDVPDEQREALAEYGFSEQNNEQFIPGWVNDVKLNVSMKSQYAIPCCDAEKRKMEFDDVYSGALVSVVVKATGKALYPVAIMVHKNGEEYNPFNMF